MREWRTIIGAVLFLAVGWLMYEWGPDYRSLVEHRLLTTVMFGAILVASLILFCRTDYREIGFYFRWHWLWRGRGEGPHPIPQTPDEWNFHQPWLVRELLGFIERFRERKKEFDEADEIVREASTNQNTSYPMAEDLLNQRSGIRETRHNSRPAMRALKRAEKDLDRLIRLLTEKNALPPDFKDADSFWEAHRAEWVRFPRTAERSDQDVA